MQLIEIGQAGKPGSRGMGSLSAIGFGLTGVVSTLLYKVASIYLQGPLLMHVVAATSQGTRRVYEKHALSINHSGVYNQGFMFLSE